MQALAQDVAAQRAASEAAKARVELMEVEARLAAELKEQGVRAQHAAAAAALTARYAEVHFTVAFHCMSHCSIPL